MSDDKKPMSFATSKKDTATSVAKAKDELRAFNDERAKGEEFMNVKRDPFCGACMWQEYKTRLRMYEYRKSNNMPVEDVSVPSWEDYAGKEKFNSVGQVQRRDRREGLINTEVSYKCKLGGHNVCISESKPWHPEMPQGSPKV